MIPINFSLSAEQKKYTGTSGCYVGSSLDPYAIEQFVDVAAKLGIEVDREKIHCTVMYSKSPLFASDDDYGTPTITAVCTEIKHWVGHNDKTYVVAALQSEALIAAHTYYRLVGAKPTFTPYAPHVSLSNDMQVDEEFERKLKDVNEWLASHPISMTLTLHLPEDINSDN